MTKLVHSVKIAKNDKNGSFIIYISYICAGIARGKKLSKAEQPNSPWMTPIQSSRMLPTLQDTTKKGRWKWLQGWTTLGHSMSSSRSVVLTINGPRTWFQFCVKTAALSPVLLKVTKPKHIQFKVKRETGFHWTSTWSLKLTRESMKSWEEMWSLRRETINKGSRLWWTRSYEALSIPSQWNTMHQSWNSKQEVIVSIWGKGAKNEETISQTSEMQFIFCSYLLKFFKHKNRFHFVPGSWGNLNNVWFTCSSFSHHSHLGIQT